MNSPRAILSGHIVCMVDDVCPVTSVLKQRLVAEANQVFALNCTYDLVVKRLMLLEMKRH